MDARTRDRRKHAWGGVRVIYDRYGTGGDKVYRYSFQRRQDLMHDFTNKKVDNYGLLPSSALEHRVRVLSPGFLSGDRPKPSYGGEYFCHVACAPTLGSTQYIVPSGHADKDRGNPAYVTQLLGETTPFRSEFSVPIYAKELLEIATMFKLAAHGFANFAGSSYLNYRFGWVQFVDDIKTLSGLTKALESRIRELKSLFLHGGLRRAKRLDSYSSSTTRSNIYLDSSHGGVKGLAEVSCKTIVYGSVRYFPAPGAYKIFDDLDRFGYFNLALRQLLDLEAPDANTVWQSIPFSWLIDYFFDVSSFLEATSEMGPVYPDYLSIVRDRYLETKLTATSGLGKDKFWKTYSGAVFREWHKTRALPSPEASWPSSIDLLTVGQWKTCLALLAKFHR